MEDEVVNELDELPIRARRFRELCAKRGLILAKVADGTGINRATLSQYRNGKTMTAEHGMLLEAYFEVPEGTFYTRPVLPGRG